MLFKVIIFALFISVPALASVGEPQSAWNKKSVRVCWGSSRDASRAELPRLTRMLIEHTEFESFGMMDKMLVRETITREYNLINTGIELIGWEDCTGDDSSDVIVFSEDQTKPPKRLTDLMFVSTYHGCSSIGDDSPGSMLKGFVHIKKLPDHDLKISSAQALELIALHEFGHLVGLRHEHARRFDAARDANCYSQGMGLLEVVGSGGKIYSVYDPNSIMNYCHDFSLMNKTGIDFYVDGLSDFNLRMNSSEGRFNSNELNFNEDSLVTRIPDVALNAIHYQVKIGLSKGDRHTLKCIYDSKYDQQNCNSGFKP